MKDCLPPTEIPKGDKTATLGWIEGEGATAFRYKTQLLATCVEVGEVNKTFAGVNAVSTAVGHDGTLIHMLMKLFSPLCSVFVVVGGGVECVSSEFVWVCVCV